MKRIKNMSQIKKPDDLQSIAKPIRFFVCMTLAMMEITQNSLAVNLTDGSALIYQALHLAKSLPFTDKSLKMGLLSVNGLLEKRRLRTKWAKIADCP